MKKLDKNQTPRKGDVLSSKCPSRVIMNNVTSKWGVLIFHALADGEVKRFSELRRLIDGVSEKMLSQTLKALEKDQFIKRTAYDVIPPYVEYSLTNLGQGAAGKVIGLTQWVETNLPMILNKK